MTYLNATDVRRDWSTVCDSVIREKPCFIKRIRDHMFLTDVSILEYLLSVYSFHAELLCEDNGTVTISLDEIDLVENGVNEQDAIKKMAASILDYSQDYYREFNYWARGNRVQHIPYVFKSLILNDLDKIGGLIECRHGEI